MDPSQWYQNGYDAAQQHRPGDTSMTQQGQQNMSLGDQTGDMDILGPLDNIQLTQTAGIESTDINQISGTVHDGPYAPGQRFPYATQSEPSRSFPGAARLHYEALPLGQKRPRINSQGSVTTTDSAYVSLNVTSGPSGYYPAPTLLGNYPPFSSPHDYPQPELHREASSRSVFSEPNGTSSSHLTVPQHGAPRQRPRGAKGQPPPCEFCARVFKNTSDAEKHKLTHTKPFLCNEPNCLRSTGFATQNDLERHRSAVHGRVPRVGRKNGFVCFACGPYQAGTQPKFWPRKDNFKAHIKRKHSDWDETHLISISASERPDDAMTVAESGYGSGAASQTDQFDSGYQHELPSPVGPEGPGQPSQQGDYPVFEFATSTHGEALLGVGEGAGPFTDSIGSGEPNPGLYASGGRYGLTVLSTAAVAMDTVGSPDSSSLLPSPRSMYSSVPQVTITEHGPGSDARNHSNAMQWSSGQIDTSRKRSGSNVEDLALVKDEEGSFPCPSCGKKKKRECDLRKHMKRHTRPYGCTFPNCYKRFGSRNDWKRHEAGQHPIHEMWRCTLNGADHRRCGNYAYDCDIFRQHLERQHPDLVAKRGVEDLSERMHIGANAYYRFWCGFCTALISQTPAENALEGRFKHIGDHYDKQDNDVDDWVCIEDNKRKGDLSVEDKRRASMRERTGRVVDYDSDLPDDGMGLPPLPPGHTEPSSSALPRYDPGMAGSSAYNTSNNKRRRLSHPNEDAECVPDDSMQMF